MNALVLSGGGALGAFEAGAIKALYDSGSKFDLICGTSIGAINASFAAQDKISELTSLWLGIADMQPPLIGYVDQVRYAIDLLDEIEKVERGNIFGLEPAIVRWAQIGSKKALVRITGFVKPDVISQILTANLDFGRLTRSLIVTATNLTFASSDAFYAFVGPNSEAAQQSFLKGYSNNAHPISRDNFELAVRSSAAIPGAFEPVSMNLGTQGNKEYVDGGVANNTPTRLAAQAGATEIVVMLLEPQQVSTALYPTANLLEIAATSLTVMQQRLLQLDMELVNTDPNVKIDVIRPSVALTLGVLEFNNKTAIDDAFHQGEAAVKDMRSLEKR